MLNNSPITRESIKTALVIWGPSVPNLDGKSVRRKGDAVLLSEETITTIPPIILSHHNAITLGVDVVKINGIPFLSTISRVVKLGSATELPNCKVESIVSALLVIIDTYIARGFSVIAVAADYAFEAIRENEDFMATTITLNTTSEDEHEPFIERFNRFLKERCRMCFSTLPFTRIPRHMTIEMVYLQIYWINFFIPRDYISTTLSPGAIVTGSVYDYNKVCGPGSQYGEYVRTHEKTDNTMAARTVSAITLRPTANSQGSFYYYSLAPGRRLVRRRCTPIVMPDEIIQRVHFIADKQNCPEGLTFTRMDGSPIPINDDDDENFVEANDQQIDQDPQQNELVPEMDQEMIDEPAPDDIEEILEPIQEEEDAHIDAIEILGDVVMNGEIMNDPENNVDPDGGQGQMRMNSMMQ